ncbi:ABC transporter ATP-binding protein [Clostridium pasteurianum]|uniref:ABC-type antimicrobial peptide transport system, ATPase component n=1 Tax=Clostridium pasteurianum BC1 TaxID=86416 RepID=R4KIR0_CLOPA|nr:ABC transporter ATP-binding protein [Clostridium pasteurianum]AGK99500.1 ABC-type antimicrobial peptide transport system, ATPase component [Clostridium pasteurianum BC1]
MIEVKNLSKIYTMGKEKVYALDNISLSIKDGEFAAIVGPSGSGKSTLMNILGCLDVPTQGNYILDGKPVESLNDDQLAEIRNEKIGFIFQRYNLLTKLNVYENVEIPLIYLGLNSGERKQRVIDALEQVGLSTRTHHKPTELSGGQQQRVSIARALATNPSLIMADEPTGALDSKTGKEVLALLQDLHKTGRTIVLITHDLAIAEKAERRIQVKDGHIISDDGRNM